MSADGGAARGLARRAPSAAEGAPRLIDRRSNIRAELPGENMP